MKKEVRIIQISITLLSIVIIAVHNTWLKLYIDGFTLTLIVIAILPWLAPLFKSIELPGGLKFEFQDLENIEKDIKKAGLLTFKKEVKVEVKPEYSFQIVSDKDPSLALAGLRIEIEKRLRDIARTKDIVDTKKGVSLLLRILADKKILTNEESRVLSDLINILNRAVHAEKIDKRAAEWAMDIGPKIIKALEQRID